MSKFLLNPLAWSILFAQFSMSAMAQSQTDQQVAELEKITIKAEDVAETSFSSTALTQFGHSLLSVPFTKSHVSEQDIKNNNIQRVSDALSMVNGVVYQDSYGGGFWDNYSFRGFSTDPNMGTKLFT